MDQIDIVIATCYGCSNTLLMNIFLSVNVYNNYLQSTQGIVSFNITTNK